MRTVPHGPVSPEEQQRLQDRDRFFHEAASSLGEDQKRVLRNVLYLEDNVFFSGPAGTGKSTLLGVIIRYFKCVLGLDECVLAVTAPTGLAARNVGGSTLHSRFVITPNATAQMEAEPDSEEVSTECVKRVVQSVKRRHMDEKWTKTQVLIIDEVSMIHPRLFDLADRTARQMRGDERPFGGIRLIVTGDFFQLPPIPRKQRTGDGEWVTPNVPAVYAFEAAAWRRAMTCQILLKTIYRQTDSGAYPLRSLLSMRRLTTLDFQQILNRARDGTITADDVKHLKRECALATSTTVKLGRGVTQLYVVSLSSSLRHRPGQGMKKGFGLCFGPLLTAATARHGKKNRVASVNRAYLARLKGPLQKYVAVDRGPPLLRSRFDQDFSAEEVLFLRVDAVVILLRNLPDFGLSNGSRGHVVSFQTRTQYEAERAGDRPDHAPASEDEEERMLAEEDDGAADPESGRVLTKTAPQPVLGEEFFPVVQFEGKEDLFFCRPEKFILEEMDGPGTTIEASRTQVPLLVAHALTVDKSQGQTLNEVFINFTGLKWRPGLAYTALSRATSLKGLRLDNLTTSVFNVSAKVRAFYHQIDQRGSFPTGRRGE